MLAAALGCAMNQKTHDTQSNQKLQILQTNRWSTPIRDILEDDFVLEDAFATSNITVEDALSHRTGLDGADLMYGAWMGQRPKSIVRALRYLAKLNAPIRTVWQYNNLMYSTVGDVLESVTGTNWGSAVRQFLWTPLGMKSTFWDPSEIPDDQRSNLARGYFWTGTGSKTTNPGLTQRFIPEPYLDFASIAPAGSVISSVTDYAKWIHELLAASANVGKTGDESDDSSSMNAPLAITPTLFSELTSPRILHPALPMAIRNAQMTPRSYSLGWAHLPSTAGIHHPVMAHSGGLTGFGTQLYLLPNDGFGVIVMANTLMSSHRIGEKLCLELMGRKLGMGVEERAEFAKSLTVFPPSAKESTDSKVKSDDMEQKNVKDSSPERYQSDADWADFVNKVAGTYSNPAYGSYQLGSYDSSQDLDKIIYDAKFPLPDQAKRDSNRAKARALSLIPIGHRTWNNRLFLRSRSDTFTASSNSGSNEDAGSGFFDLEYLSVHGMSQTLAQADEDGKKKANGTSSDSTVWQSEHWSPYGAFVKHAPRSDAQNHAGSTSRGDSWSIGVRLGNSNLLIDGNTEKDWETKMVWFDKVEAG